MNTDPEAYNGVFDKLVDSADDLEGLLAYGLYKQHKRDWLLQHREKYGRRPTVEEERIFVDGVLSDPSAYAHRASEAILAFADGVVTSQRDEIALEAIEQHVADSTREMKEQLGFWRGVGSQMISFFAVSVILVLLALSVERVGIDLLDLFFPQ